MKNRRKFIQKFIYFFPLTPRWEIESYENIQYTCISRTELFYLFMNIKYIFSITRYVLL